MSEKCAGWLCHQKPESERNEAQPPHPCPYNQEVTYYARDKSVRICTCCVACQERCAE